METLSIAALHIGNINHALVILSYRFDKTMTTTSWVGGVGVAVFCVHSKNIDEGLTLVLPVPVEKLLA